MPFESLSCPRCGSGDAQEVKPETYFCNHCDNVFKYVRPSRAGSAGGCEVSAERLPCGIPAIGRCRSCQRAFCLTHQARVGEGLQDRLDSERRYAAGSGYPDWCIACRAAELYVPIDDDESALNRAFGLFLQEWFSAKAVAPGHRVVNDLATAAERALTQYGGEPDVLVASSIREDFQLGDGDVVDGTAFASGTSERLTCIRKPDGTRFYRHDSLWSGRRSRGSYVSVWIASGSEMLVAKCTRFDAVRNPDDALTYLPPVIRYTEVEGVGVSRIEGIAASLERSFPPSLLSPPEKAPVGKAVKRRWFG
jgi:hypothetical protein